jgi:hypothetical protein
MDPEELERLRADARYHRERLELYRAKAYGPRPTSATRLRELERAHQVAQDRLDHALREERAREREG